MEYRMPCHITDGPQTPEDVPSDVEENEDDAYERIRQQEIDSHERQPTTRREPVRRAHQSD